MQGAASPARWSRSIQTRYASIGLSISTDHVRLCLLDLSGEACGAGDRSALAASRPEQVIDLGSPENRRNGANRVSARGPLSASVSTMQGFRTGPDDLFQPPELLVCLARFAAGSLSFNKELALPAFAENNATASALAEYYLGAGTGAVTRSPISRSTTASGPGSIPAIARFWAGMAMRGRSVRSISPMNWTSGRRFPGYCEPLRRKGMQLDGVMDMTSRVLMRIGPALLTGSKRSSRNLHLALRALQATVDPEAIFFGGEAPDALRLLFMEAAEGAFRDKRLPRPSLIVSALPGDPAHLGAGLLPLHQLVF